VLCGTRKARAGRDPLWQDLALAALEPGARVVPVTLGGETFDSLEWRRDWSLAAEPATASEPKAPRAAAPLPAFFDADPPPPPRAASRVQPSESGSGSTSSAASALALERGTIIHRLLQALPEHAPPERARVARDYLASVAASWTAEARTGLADALAALLDDAAVAPLFGEGSRAEVAIAGSLMTASGPLQVSGRIDRLVVEPARILIADFKTNTRPPARIDQVQESYILQLALYRAVLQRLYPGRRVEAALVFTETPRLIAVPAERMDGHISRITAS
jgi:ATP-dependent helicase/nuclease subunit A